MCGSESEAEWAELATYRIAFGHASDLADDRKFSLRPGASKLGPRDEGEVRLEVVRRMTQVGEVLSLDEMELIKEAVADVIAQRRPRW